MKELFKDDLTTGTDSTHAYVESQVDTPEATVTRGWEDAQEKWIVACSTRWKRSSARWMTKFLRAIWEVSWEIWQHRNKVLHHPSHPWRPQHTRDLDCRIEDDFSSFCEANYLPNDRRLFLSTAVHIQRNYSDAQEEQWLASVAMVKMRSSQTHDTSLTSSRLFMKNWLMQGIPTGAPTLRRNTN